ncbi:FadR family transcriptional regulator [Arthrobacter crusticola]|uniref:FadR family transcriptional regulator n=1 Tax=Arthrobacter crusticola TaxID=2547960 RepID=A0A4V3ALV4_9MICC|nr:FadR/GntR family transcriptional regulator [Arthrobacter crusticola]TDK24548.1 FadR family transcriptional regulator [Arthrobacter crusticola]
MEWSSMRRSPALSVPDRLAVDLERLILEGELKPGDRLPTEQELGQLFGVSRVSIRQALHQLDARGLIDRKPGRGTIVRSAASRGGQAGTALTTLLSSAANGTANGTTELARIMELRAIIEPPIAALAAERLTQGDAEQLRGLVEEMERETDLERYAELDRIFHQAISQYTHNPLLAQLTDLIATEIAPSRRRSVQSPERRAASSLAHRRIFEALAEHDALRAETEARAHVESVLREALRAAASTEPQPIPKEQE